MLIKYLKYFLILISLNCWGQRDTIVFRQSINQQNTTVKYKITETIKDTSIDFNKYKTFAFLKDNSPNNILNTNNRSSTTNVIRVIKRQFGLRGVKSTSGDPDLMVQILISNKNSVERKIMPNTTTEFVDYEHKSLKQGGSVHKYEYTEWQKDSIKKVENEICITIIERNSCKTIWVCKTNVSFEGDSQFEDYEKLILKMIMKKYPLKPVSFFKRKKNREYFTYLEKSNN